MERSRTTYLYAVAFSILGLGALLWLSFFMGAHGFGRDLSQEKRHAEIVGAAPLPAKPIKIILSQGTGNIRFSRVTLTGKEFWIYYFNSGRSGADSHGYEIKWKAPDGTIINRLTGEMGSDTENNAPNFLQSGEHGEAHIVTNVDDPRTMTVEIRPFP